MDNLPNLAAAGACALPLLYTAYRFGGQALDDFCVRKFTVLPDIDKLGQPRRDENRIRGTVVICGGRSASSLDFASYLCYIKLGASIAGLWTALVASDHFEDVLILEPEAWLDTEEGRSNTYDEHGKSTNCPKNNVRTRVSQYHGLHGEQATAPSRL